jgi:hypothetical protein
MKQTEATFSLALTRVTDDVRRALARIAAEEAPETELHNLRATRGGPATGNSGRARD